MSTLSIPERELAVQLAQVGSKHSHALAKVAFNLNIEPVDAIDLAMVHAHPTKVEELAKMGLQVPQMLIVYAVVEHYGQIYRGKQSKESTFVGPSLRQIATFATWFCGVDFDEEELVESIECARRMTRFISMDLSSELSYALGYGISLNNHSIESIEVLESERIERLRCLYENRSEEIDDSGEGQGDDIP